MENMFGISHPQTWTTLQTLNKVAISVFERLGDAAGLIEVLKLTVVNLVSGVELINVKLVIKLVEPYFGKVTRIETEFERFCNHGFEDVFEQKIVTIFRKTLGDQINTDRKEADGLSTILYKIDMREMKSGNGRRCKITIK